MRAATRQVRRLHLNVSDSSAGQRGVTLLQDAFRTASIAEAADGRVLVIRRLDLGRFSKLDTANSLALRLEACLRILGAEAVHYANPGARHARAVYFSDPVEPYIAFAKRAATGRPTEAWFWRSVIPGDAPGMTPRERVKLALHHLLVGDAGLTAAAALVSSLVEIQKSDILLDAIEPTEGAWLLNEAGLRPLEPGNRSFGRRDSFNQSGETDTTLPAVGTDTMSRWETQTARTVLATVHRGFETTLHDRVDKWGPEDPRATWLAAAAVLTANRGTAASPDLSERAHAVIKWIAASKTRSSDRRRNAQDVGPAIPLTRVFENTTGNASAVPSADEGIAEKHGLEEERAVSARQPIDSEPCGGVDRGISSGAASPKNTEAAARENTAIANADPAEMAAAPRSVLRLLPRPSAFCGLFFLIAVFERLGIREMLDAHPDWTDWGFVHRLFQRVADQLAVPDDDPIRLPVGEIPRAPVKAVVSELSIPASWEDLLDKPARSSERLDPETSMLTILDTWTAAAARWLERYCKMSLTALVQRPGSLQVTCTHLDMLFDLNHAEVRIRRAGLDINPGWVPWFGRVVTYHYLIGGRRDCD